MEILICNAVLLLLEAFFLMSTWKAGGKSGRQIKTVFMVLAFVQLYVLHAFLDPTTMKDLPGYVEVYEELEYKSPFTLVRLYSGVYVKMELGWMIMNKILCVIWNNPRFLLLVTSIGIVGGYFYAIKKYSPMIGLSVILFYFTTYAQSLFVLRQHLAIALCLLAVPYILQRKQKKFLLLVFLAFSLHMSAIIFLPIYYLYNLQVDYKFWGLFIVALVIGTMLMQSVSAWIYANTWYGAYEDADVSNFTPLAISVLVMFLYFYCSRWRINGIEHEEKLFFMMGLIGVVISFWCLFYSGFSRLTMYFTVCNIFLIPISINKVRDQSLRIVIIMLCVVCYGALFYYSGVKPLADEYHLIF